MSRPTSNAIEVLAVDVAAADRRLRGGHLGVPKPGDSVDRRELLLRGWALGEDGAAREVEIVHGEHVVGRAPIALERPDIAAEHGDLPHAARSGFEHRLNLLAAGGELSFDLRVVLNPILRAPLARVTVRAAAPAGDERVAVVIPCFNQAHFLGEAIESVLGQADAEIEVVVVDDGSPDNTGEVAARYPGVRCIRQENAGLAAARNTGLARTESDFVLFLDADDRLLPDAAASGLDELRAAPEAIMAAGGWRLIGEDGETLPSTPPEPPADPYAALLESCIISSPATVIYRRRLFAAVGSFDPSVSASADYDLYLRAAARFPVRIHDKVVAEYRRHGANMTRDPELIMRSELAVLERQAPVVAERPELREAHERGLRRTRAYHGGRMVEAVRRQVDAGQRGEAMRASARLARLYPQGFRDALRALRRPRLP